MSSADILARLERQGLIHAATAVVEPLTGGVSSDIFLVNDGERRLVIKQALAKLRVAAEWFADPIRNRYEQAYIAFVAGIDPTAVPRILCTDEELSFFAMEFLAPPLENWKSRLLVEPGKRSWAEHAGEILGKIHAASWDRADVKCQFETTENFHKLRSDAYFLYAAGMHPEVSDLIRERVALLESNRRCLVHGDFSPKNILVSDERLVVLDCETAWFGDPTFDVGFLLNHLFIKALHCNSRSAEYLELAEAFWNQYAERLGGEHAADVEKRLMWLLPMLLLARVDGKSPVEYLPPDKQEVLRCFGLQHIKSTPSTLNTLKQAWQKHLQNIPA